MPSSNCDTLIPLCVILKHNVIIPMSLWHTFISLVFSLLNMLLFSLPCQCDLHIMLMLQYTIFIVCCLFLQKSKRKSAIYFHRVKNTEHKRLYNCSKTHFKGKYQQFQCGNIQRVSIRVTIVLLAWVRIPHNRNLLEARSIYTNNNFKVIIYH